jgi:phage head maturation protease
MKIIDSAARIFEGWATVEIVDKQGDIIPIDEVEKAFDIYVKNGGAIVENHSNKVVGRVISWKREKKNGVDGIYIVGQIFEGLEPYDEVWEKVKNGIYKGLSFGGRAGKKAVVKYNGKFVDVLQDITPLEISLCENPANPEALIEAVSVAKSEDIKKPDDARPPKEWWERCVARVREEGVADDPEALCGYVFYHVLGGDRERAKAMLDISKEDILTFAKYHKIFKCAGCNNDSNILEKGGCMNERKDENIKKEAEPAKKDVKKEDENAGSVSIEERIKRLEDIVANLAEKFDSYYKSLEELKVAKEISGKEVKEEKPEKIDLISKEDLQKVIKEEIKKALAELKIVSTPTPIAKGDKVEEKKEKITALDIANGKYVNVPIYKLIQKLEEQ